jgi:hypothetical protein
MIIPVIPNEKKTEGRMSSRARNKMAIVVGNFLTTKFFILPILSHGLIVLVQTSFILRPKAERPSVVACQALPGNAFILAKVCIYFSQNYTNPCFFTKQKINKDISSIF